MASTVRGVYDGGAGHDTVDYSGFADGITVDLRNGVTTLGGKAIHTLIDIDAIVGTRHDDVLIAGSENAQLYGGAGNDVFFSGAGQNLLSGGEGRDVVDYSQATRPDGVHASLAAGRTQAGRNGYGGTDTYEGIEGLIGSRFNDTLEGDAGDNTIFAGDGDDTVVGSAGSDVLDGGAGRNTLDYSKLDVALNINLVNGTVQKAGGGTDQVSNFVEVLGGGGNDTFQAVSGSTLRGGLGDDTFIGTLGSTTIDGGEGRDLVDYSALNQALYIDLQTGFASTLTAVYVNGSMVFRFNDATAFGRDTLTDIEDVYASFSAGTNYLLGSAADNHMKGGRYVNYFDGGDGNNTLDGTAGTSDYALYASSSSAVTAILNSAGSGTVTHGGFTDTLTAFEGIWGSDHDDSLTAENSRTLLFGGKGNDTLKGGTAYYAWGATQGIQLDLAAGVAMNDGYGTQDQLINVDNVTGTYGFNDTIWGNDNANIITEINGNNYIYGSKGNDTLSLGNGNNTVDYSLLDRGITANLSTTVQTIGKAEYGTDRVSGVRNITGTAQADSIIGNNDNNTLMGNGGADILVGNGGNDVLIGGADGLATASYHTSPQGIDANLSSGQVQDGFGSFDTLVQIGKIVGSSKGDRFTFSNQADLSRYQIDGGSGGNDVMAKQGAGGTFHLDSSVRISHISTIDFADGKTDRVAINLNQLVSGPESSSLTVRLDAQDSFTISQTGWTMTENTADHQTWSQGGHTVVVAH
ncbi:hypothetical protein DDE05_11305 [Streptomyces cavourensis]|nr:hypothetical protein DDE05_11305 [Streptomyces cavourensis]